MEKLIALSFLLSGMLAILFGFVTVFKFSYKNLSHNQKYHVVRAVGTGIIGLISGMTGLKQKELEWLSVGNASIFLSGVSICAGFLGIYISRDIRHKIFKRPIDFETYMSLMSLSIGGIFFIFGLISVIGIMILKLGKG